ncbi:MAG: hypothetical protein M3R08_09765 [Bacteroidota bacterium]|nr:hypothetical protein [Bacteroidota bacterium]
MIEIRNSILAGLGFGFFFGLFIAVRFNLEYSISVGPISGIAFGTALYFFVTSKVVRSQTNIEINDGTKIIRSGGANHFINGEAVGGKLYLLVDILHFKSHNFNFQNHGHIIEIAKVKEVSYYNTLGLVPNGLAITTVDGQTERFVVNGRQSWRREIEKLVSDRCAEVK